MACYHPISAYREATGRIHLWPQAHTSATLQLPCGKCIGCTTTYALHWAHRCAHEAKKFENNLFLTLTYDDDNLPAGGHLVPRDLTLFLKRLRQHRERDIRRHRQGDRELNTDPENTLRYFACGEYGETTARPHYHAILFNVDFVDKHRVGRELYESETLHTLWKHGKAAYGTATAKAANYVAQYQLKKHRAPEELEPPFLRMSNRPAIGSAWLAEYKTDLRHGYLVGDQGRKYAIPRTYKRTLKKTDPDLLAEIEANIAKNNTTRTTEIPEQLLAHEKIHLRVKELSETGQFRL